jgi:hypothetical protein
VSKAKKKVAKKTVAKKARPVSAGARDVGFRERKLAEVVLRSEVDEVRASVDDEPAPVCAAFNCYEHVADYGDHCAKHGQGAPFPSAENITAEDMAGAVDALAAAPLPTMVDRHYNAPPHVVSEPFTEAEILASDNAVIRETYLAHLQDFPVAPCAYCGTDEHGTHEHKAAPEHHVYVPPAPGPRPVLPAPHHALEFHTPPGRKGMYVDVAFALLPEAGVVVRRVLDRLAGTAAYAIAGVGDLDDVQYMEIGSHYWHDATEEERAAIAVREFETDLRRIAQQAGPVAEAFAERLLTAEGGAS